jgi:hypothetical protein
MHAYFRANFEYANTLRKHMRRGYIGACPLWAYVIHVTRPCVANNCQLGANNVFVRPAGCFPNSKSH